MVSLKKDKLLMFAFRLLFYLWLLIKVSEIFLRKELVNEKHC